MLKLSLSFAAWVAGSYACYQLWGTRAILPYAGLTTAGFILYVVLANRKPRG